MAIQNTFYLDVDIKRDNYVDEPKVTQNDAVTFVLRMTDDGVDYPLAGVSTYTLASLRPDNQSVLTVGTLTGVNEITFELGSTEVSVPGNVKAAIQLYDVDGRVSSIPFTYEVTKDIATGYIPSKDEQTLIELVLGQGPAILTAAQTATITANDAATNADAKAALANAEAQDANAAAIYARDKGLLAEQKAALADASANEADTATYNAENATQEAQDATNAINAVLPNVEGLENRGEYNSATTYVKNNLVERNGSSWQALQDTLGNPPPTLPTKSNAYWTLISQRGIDGMGAVSTVNGEGPDVNGNVSITIPDPDLSGLATKTELQSMGSEVTKKVNKGELVVNVKDFGARGDGIADDTAAINAAINSLPTGTIGGGTVFLPTGHYKVSSSILLKSGVTLIGASSRSSRITTSTSDIYLLLINAAQQTSVKDLMFDGGGISYGIRITGSNGCKIENLWMDSLKVAFASEGSLFLSFDNVKIMGTALGYSFYTGSNVINMKNCYSVTTQQAITWENSSTLDVSGCSFEGKGVVRLLNVQGASFDGNYWEGMHEDADIWTFVEIGGTSGSNNSDAAYAKGISFTGNYFLIKARYGISLRSCEGVNITGNYFGTSLAGIDVYSFENTPKRDIHIANNSYDIDNLGHDITKAIAYNGGEADNLKSNISETKLQPLMFIKQKVPQDVTIEKESGVLFWDGVSLKIKIKNANGVVSVKTVTLS